MQEGAAVTGLTSSDKSDKNEHVYDPDLVAIDIAAAAKFTTHASTGDLRA